MVQERLLNVYNTLWQLVHVLSKCLSCSQIPAIVYDSFLDSLSFCFILLIYG